MPIDDTIFADLLAQAEADEAGVRDRIEDKASKLMEFLKERVKANAPVQTGALAAAITLSAAHTDTGVEYTVSANTSYALQVHERPPVEGRKDPDGSEPEGGRGRRYISRVMNAHAQEIADVLK